ncbi:MAG: GtrA family protein [Roseburia inulinivorans]
MLEILVEKMMKTVLYKYKKLILYILFGGMTTILNWIVYAIGVKLQLGITISNILAWSIAVFFAFITNKLFVFESKILKLRVIFNEFIKFVGARILTGAIEIGGLPLLYYLGMNQQLFGIDGFIAKIMISIIVMVLNYVFSQVLVFKK